MKTIFPKQFHEDFVMNFIRKLSILKIFCFLFCMTTNAGIPTLAFKNVFSCFKPEKNYCAPNFGAIALRAGIIENIRFNLVQQAFDSNGRDYKRDKAYDGKDPLVTMVLILFPSHAGQLATEANTKDNLGQHCTVEHVAHLLKFTDVVRTYFANLKAAPLPSNITKVLAKLGLSSDWITQNLPTDASITKNRNKLLTSIIQAVKQEAKNTFYPKYLIEQIISAFFCHKFTNTDIPILLQALGSNFVDETKIVAQEFITQEDIQSAMAKDHESLNLDDIWAFFASNDISGAFPYSTKPISNGLAKMYTRNPEQEFNTNFADCTESVIRHILNLTLYDSIYKKFDLNTLIEHMKKQNPDFDPEHDPTFKWVKEFYAQQPPDKANDGTQVTRSLWNKVVADLGDEIEYLKDADGRKSNELNSGMINILQVLNKLFDLKLKPRPAKNDSPEFIAEAQKWIQESLETFFTCASKKKFTFNISNLKNQSSSKYGDIVGKIIITAYKNNTGFFSYTIHSMQGHAQIEDLKKLQEPTTSIISMPTIKAFVIEHTIFESLFLLQNNLKEQIPNSFYSLFSESINDSVAIINTLEKLQSLLKKDPLSNSIQIGTLIKNILSIFPWQDYQGVKNINNIILKLRNYTNEDKVHLRNALQEGVKGFILSEQTAPLLESFFKNVENLYIEQIEAYNFTEPLAYSIKNITAQGSKLKKLTGLDKCKKLESLSCDNIKLGLNEIIFTGKMNALKKINITSSKLTQIAGLEYCHNLEELYMSQTGSLKEIFFLVQ